MIFGIITSLCCGTLFAGPLKVYILAGQSNMQGHALDSTLPYMALDQVTKPLLQKLVDEKGVPKIFPDVHVTAVSERGTRPTAKDGPLSVGFGKHLQFPTSFGPELAFGATLYDNLKEPILIIKTAWGGKSLHTNYRPPSAGPYTLPKEVKKLWDENPKGGNGAPDEAKREEFWAKKKKETGHYYRLMIESVKNVLADPSKVCSAYDPKKGYELAGMAWFQGFNDLVDGGAYPRKDEVDRYKMYSTYLSHFIRDIRKDLSAPKMPFVIGVLGVGGAMEDMKPGEGGYEFRKAMAAPAELPEFKGNVFSVQTGQFWDKDIGKIDVINSLHYKRITREFNRKNPGGGKDLSREDRRDYVKRRKEHFDKGFSAAWTEKFPDTELAPILKGTANAGYHYFGSGKILSQIGEAFAKQLLENRN